MARVKEARGFSVSIVGVEVVRVVIEMGLRGRGVGGMDGMGYKRH